VDAFVTNTHPWTGYDVRVRGDDVLLDDQLFEALSNEYQDLWRRFALKGRINTDVQISRPNGDEHGSRQTKMAVELDLIDTKLQFDQFPYPLETVSGHVMVDDSGIRIEKLAGRGPSGAAESAEIRVEGR